MNAVRIADFEAQIRAFGWTINGAARFFGVTDRTMRRWVAENEVARPVAMLLALMRDHPDIAEPRKLLKLAGLKARDIEEIVSKLADQRPWMQD